MKSLHERFESKFMPEPNSGCWLWLDFLNSDGYGQMRVYERTIRAHRISYQLYIGEIPSGLEIDHLCRVRCCVNPDHLEVVTHQENIRRGNGGRNCREKTHCPKGHPYSGANLYTNPHSGSRACRTCGRESQRRYVGGLKGLGGNYNKQKTHCIRGHELSGDNLRVARDGRRSCFKCRAIYPSALHRRSRRIKGTI